MSYFLPNLFAAVVATSLLFFTLNMKDGDK